MNNNPKTQNDIAWEKLFDKYDIKNQIDINGSFIITAKQIKEFREPRLMAKFDHRINLPQIFSKNKLAILPITRGNYIISDFEAYKSFESLDKSIINLSLPSNLQSLDSNNISSEAIAINCALASGILSDFFAENYLHPTVYGRMGSGNFKFDILKNDLTTALSVEVNNAQVEIDAAFEGIESLFILEAKIDVSKDFLIRQLYYPFKLWQSKITKKVRPIFLVYSNGIFSLYEYEFKDPDLYNSLVLIKHKNYTIEDISIEFSDILDIMKKVNIQPEPKIPFPQANNFNRVINLCELLLNKDLSREEITEEYAFDIRQTNYYTDAARYLGLVGRKYDSGRKPIYFLTQKGRKILSFKYKQKQMALCECILEHKAFYKVFELCQNGVMPDKKDIVNIMKNSNLYNIDKDKTYERRSSTISGWINWIIKLMKT